MGPAETDHPHRVPAPGEDHDIGFAIDVLDQGLISDLTVVFASVPSNDGAFPVQQCRTIEGKPALLNIPGVFPWVEADLHHGV